MHNYMQVTLNQNQPYPYSKYMSLIHITHYLNV